MNQSENANAEQHDSDNRSWSWTKLGSWILGVFLCLALLVYFLVPPIAASFVRSGIISAAEEHSGGTCTIESLSLSWGGSVHIGKMTVTDRADQTMISIDEIDGHIDPLAAIGGTYRLEATIRRPAISVRRLENGRLNLVSQQDSDTNANPNSEDADPSRTGNGPLSSVRGSIEITGGNLRFTGPEGDQTELQDVEIRTTLFGNEQPAELSLSLRTPGDNAGTITANGTLNPDTLRDGSVDAKIDQFPLSELSAAAALFSRARNLEGQVDGSLTLSRAPSFSSNTNLTVRNVHVEGFGEPIDLPEATLTQESSMDPSGTGSFSANIQSEQMLTASVDGTMKNVLTTERTLDASWSLNSDLKKASQRIPTLLNLNMGWRLDGSLTSDGKLVVQPTTGSDGTTIYEGQFDMQANGSSVSATDPNGKTVSLGNPSFEADVSSSVSSTESALTGLPIRFVFGRVKTLTATFPGLESSFSGGWTYASSFPELDDLSGSLNADLAQLRTKLAPFVDFRGYDVDGTIDLTMKGSGSDPFQSTGRLTTSNLVVTGADMSRTGPFNITLNQSSTVDAKNGTIRLNTLELNGEGLTARLRDGQLDRLAQPDTHAQATWNATADLGVLTKKLSPVLKPRYVTLLNRPDVRSVNGTVDAGGSSATVALRRADEGWISEFNGNVELSGLAYVLDNGQQVPLRDHVMTRLRGVSYHTGSGTTGLDTMELRTSGLTLDLNNIKLNPMDRPIHIDSLSAKLNTDLSQLRNLTRIYGSDTPSEMAGTIEGTVGLTGEPGTRGRMKMNTNLRFNGVKMSGFDGGTAGPFTGRVTSSGDVLDLREKETSRFHDVTLDTEWMNFTAAGTATGLGAGVPSASSIELSGTVRDPERASDRLKPFLAGYQLSGEPVNLRLRASVSPEKTSIEGHNVTSSSLSVRGGQVGEEGITFKNLRSTGAITLAADQVNAEQLEFSSHAAVLTVNGRLPLNSTGGSTVDLTSSINLSLADVSPLFPEGYRNGNLSGAVNGQVKIGGQPEQMTISSEFSSGDFTYTPSGAEQAVMDDESIKLTSDVTVRQQDQSRKLTLRSIQLDSSFIRFNGTNATAEMGADRIAWSQWDTSLDYHPDRLGAIAGPMLPQDVTLMGSEWQSAHFTLAAGDAYLTELPYALEGEGTYEVDRVEWQGTPLKGDGTMKLEPDVGTVTWDLTSQDGTVNGSAEFDMRSPEQLRSPDERSHRFRVDAQNVKTRQKMSPYLQMLHPLFASIGGETEGTVDVSFDLNMTGPLTGADPMKRLSGPGSLHASNVQIRSGSFAGQVLSLIDEQTSWNVSIPKVDLRIDGQRIHHSGFPIQLSDHRLTTSGWISVNGNYQLDVNLPVTDQLIEKYPQLKSLKGEYLTLPVKQIDGSPSIDMQGFIQKAVQKAIQNQLQDRLRGLFN